MRLVDLLGPWDCAGCGGADGPACSGCLAVLRASAAAHRPTPCPAGLPPTWAVADYDGAARALILACKERGAAHLARPLAGALAGAVVAAATADAAPDPVLLVPVPSTRSAVRARGDDVVMRLARLAAGRARRAGVDVRVAPVLRHARRVADSAGLHAGERAANLAGALEVARTAAGAVTAARVVVVDDIVTTGATLAEAARALRCAGAQVVGAAVIAATRRRHAAAC